MTRRLVSVVVVLVSSAVCGGCTRSSQSKTESTLQGNQALGLSPATWPQEGPSPITGGGLVNPASFSSDVTGAVHRLVVDPAGATTLYAGSVNGGVWKTTTANSIFAPTPQRVHWTTNTDSLPSLTIGALAMDLTNPQHLVAGTGQRSNGLPPGAEGLVYVTSDGGTTWTVRDDPSLRGKRIRGIALRGNLILIAAVDSNDDTHGFVFRSTNNGANWNNIGGTGGLPAAIGSAFDVIADPSSTDRYYVVVANRGWGGSGLYLGTNSGQTWTRISDTDTSVSGLPKVLQAWALTDEGTWFGGPNNARLAIGSTGVLYVTVESIGRLSYVGYTQDQGAHWTAMTAPTRQMDVPSNPADVVAPAVPTNIARVQRGSVSGGNPTTILVDVGSPHQIRLDVLSGKSLHVRILGVTGLTNDDWFAAPYFDPVDNNPAPASGPIASKTKFILLSRLTRQDGDGTTTALNVTGAGTYQCWIGPNEGGQGDPNLALAVDPTNSKYVYLGGDAGPLHLVRGDNTLSASNVVPSPQWSTLVNDGTVDGKDLHADIRDLVLDSSGQYLFLAEDGGLFVRTNPRDSTGTWYTISGDLMSAELRSIALDPLSHALLGGAQDNGTPSQLQPSNGTPQPWAQIETADGVGVAAVDGHTTAVDPVTGNPTPISYRYTSFQGSNDFRQHIFAANGSLISTNFLIAPGHPELSKLVVGTQTTDAGVVTLHLNDVENFDWVSAIGVNRIYDPAASPQPNPQNWLLIAGHKKGVWESRDLGATISLVPGSPTNARYFSYGNASNVEALWVIAENYIKSVGQNQTTVHSRLVAGASLTLENTMVTSGNGASAIAMSASNPNLAYFTADFHVYQMSHGGAPVDITGDLKYLTNGPYTGPGRLRSIVYVPSATTGDRVIVGAGDGGVPGVFMMAVGNPGVWTRIGTNLPNANPMALDYDPGNQMLVVGTGGRGAWSLLNVTSLNRAPNALCKDVTVPADSTCHGTATPGAFNNGWLDPDGNVLTATSVDPISLIPVPIGNDPLGTFSVTINLADSQGASALCTKNLKVVDTTPPTLSVPANKALNSCADSASISVGLATANDNCAGALVPTGQVIIKNGTRLATPIPVVNGQVTLGPGTYTIQWTVSDGANPPVQGNQIVTIAAAIETSQTFLLDDRAQLKTPSGGFAAVLNAGSGNTRVGQDCRTAGVLSVGPVIVQHRAIVSGNVVSGSTVQKDSDATVTGSISTNASVQLPALPALPAFPAPALGGFTVNSGVTVTKAPGSYSSATILNGGTLIMQGGDYYFQSLTINSGSIVRVAPSTRVFVRDTLIFNASFLASSGSAVQSIYLGFAGATLNMYAIFNGTLVAPNASVIFGTGSGLTFTGSFFGKAFEVTAGSVLVCSI
jgi:hypothetical protein